MPDSFESRERPADSTSRRVLSTVGITVLCITLSALVIVPFFFSGHQEAPANPWQMRMPDTHDMVGHVAQMESFYTGLSAGEIYPRWEEDTNLGMGAPTGIFYPPAFYYLTSAMMWISSNSMVGILVVVLALTIASGGAVYVYARRYLSRPAALVTLVAYLVFPYRLIDFYIRGALPELLSFLWMPLILLFITRIFHEAETDDQAIQGRDARHTRLKLRRGRAGGIPRALIDIAGLGISYAAFLWSHPPTAYQFTLTFGLFALALGIFRRDWLGLVIVTGGMAVGLALSAAYLYPAAVEQNFIHREVLQEDWPYHETYVFYDSDFVKEIPDFYRLINETWVVNTTVIVGGIAGLLWIRRRLRMSFNPLREPMLLWMLIGLFGCFMMTSASMVIGRHLPEIEIGVFSWRMLSITALASALLLGAVTEGLLLLRKEDNIVSRALLAGMIGVCLLSVVWFSFQKVFIPASRTDVFEPDQAHMNDVIIPEDAPEDLSDLPELPRTTLALGKGHVTIEEWKPQHRVLQVELKAPAQLGIRTFYYPGWKATVDGRSEKIQLARPWGTMRLDLPSGTHRVILDFIDTPDRRLGALISLSTFGLLLVGFIGGTLVARAKREREKLLSVD